MFRVLVKVFGFRVEGSAARAGKKPAVSPDA